MPDLFQRRDLCIMLSIGFGLKADVNKDAIIPVSFRSGELLAVDWDDAFTQLPRRLGEELFQPGPQVRNSGRSDDCDLVVSGESGTAQYNSQYHPGIFFHRRALVASPHHFRRAFEELFGVQSHDCGRHHAEIRKRRIASADGGTSVENGAEAIGLSYLLHLRTGVSNGDEM